MLDSVFQIDWGLTRMILPVERRYTQGGLLNSISYVLYQK